MVWWRNGRVKRRGASRARDGTCVEGSGRRSHERTCDGRSGVKEQKGQQGRLRSDEAEQVLGKGDVKHGLQAVVIAYACRPGEGSESGAGWEWARAAAEVADVTLLAGVHEDRPYVVAEVERLGLSVTPVWVPLPSWVERIVTVGSEGGFVHHLMEALRYCLWQVAAAAVLLRLERRGRVDVVHHVTFASDSLPTALVVSRAPVRIWGPVGGVTRTPAALFRYLGVRGSIDEMVRVVGTYVSRGVFGNLAARRASVVLALNGDVERRFRDIGRRVLVESNTAFRGAPRGLSDDAESGLGKAPVALYAGRLLPLKGLRLALQALQYAPGWRLVILGDGPEREALRRIALRLGVETRVELRGTVSRADVLRALGSADAFLFPSFHDSASAAVAEASALGCPVVCLDLGGSPAQAGRNAHVVPVRPAASLPRRIGEALVAISGRGAPDNHLAAERIVGVLESLYSG